MKVLITGICGFAGNAIARSLLRYREGLIIHGIDNLSRKGSESNLEPLRQLGCQIRVADLRTPGILSDFPQVDWLIDAAAEPSVLAGTGSSSSEDLLHTNLGTTIPMLEFCKKFRIPFTLLSTSRVYGIQALQGIRLESKGTAFHPALGQTPDFSSGIPEDFPQNPPLSLYGVSKRCSELLALEYCGAFDFPVWINRCGVLAGPRQFGKADQGIFSFWIHRWARKLPLKYIGFGAKGLQVRDCLNPEDLVPLLLQQFDCTDHTAKPQIINLSGGIHSATSLQELSHWCSDRFGPHNVNASDENRPFDAAWIVLNSDRALREWNWMPSTPKEQLFDSIAQHAEANPKWLELCGASN